MFLFFLLLFALARWWRCWRADLSGFIKLLELPKYTSVVKTLNAGINIDTDVDLDGKGQSGGDGDGVDPTKQPSQQRPQMKQLSADTLSAPTELPKEQRQKHQKQQQNDKAQKAKQREQHSDTSSLAHCHQLAEQLAYDYNKSALFWPCPQMKVCIQTSHLYMFACFCFSCPINNS